MDRKRQRRVYVTTRQKKKLVEMITKHPELITRKAGEGYSLKESEKLWYAIAIECNALAGARKTWKQWRKTWQDLRSKNKKKSTDSRRSQSPVTLTAAEQEVLGIRGGTATARGSESPQEQPEFIHLNEEEVTLQDSNYGESIDYTENISEPESPPEMKVFTSERRIQADNDSNYKNSKHCDCEFNCNVLTSMEQKKLKVKEDYLKFRKEYLKQKLKLIKEQTDALKSIAQELGK